MAGILGDAKEDRSPADMKTGRRKYGMCYTEDVDGEERPLERIIFEVGKT